MKRWKQNRYVYIGLTMFLTFVGCLIFFDLFSSVNPTQILSALSGILPPFFIGFAIAYLLNPLMRFFEQKFFAPLIGKRSPGKYRKLIRCLSVFFSLLIASAVIFFLLLLLIPQALASVVGIIQNTPLYLNTVTSLLDNFFRGNPDALLLINDIFSKISENIQVWLSTIAAQIPAMLDAIANGVFGVIDWMKNLVLGVIISFYVLYHKEKFVSQFKKTLFALLPNRIASKSIRLFGEIHLVFGGFITGVLIDSTLVGILCFIGLSLMNMPYAVLISCLVGVFNIIPFLGPFLGGIPSAIIILLEDPKKVIWFVLFMVILQQFDGNIMSPKILGGATGLPTFWVLFAIIAGGGLFGFLGMLLGVPVFSVIYTLVSRAIDQRLIEKNLPTNTNDYLHSKQLQEWSNDSDS